MAYEYLVASWPMLFFEDPPPFSLEAFRAQCEGGLSSSDEAARNRILEGRPPDSGAGRFERAWYARETQLRNETASVRAGRAGTDIQAHLRDHEGYDASLREAVSDAFEQPNPLERELALDRSRWRELDELRVGDDLFGISAVLAYAVKLQILERWASRTNENGQKRVEAWMEGTGDE